MWDKQTGQDKEESVADPGVTNGHCQRDALALGDHVEGELGQTNGDRHDDAQGDHLVEETNGDHPGDDQGAVGADDVHAGCSKCSQLAFCPTCLPRHRYG